MSTQAFSGDTYARGERCRVSPNLDFGVIQVVGDNGWYVVRMDAGNARSVHHSAIDTFGMSCSSCGAAFDVKDDEFTEERAEVVNLTTEARSVMHVECYLSDRCCYALA